VTSAPTKTAKPENIFIVVNTFGRGGAEMSLAILANELAKRGHKVTLLALWRDPNSYNFDWLVESGVKLTVLAESKRNVVISQFKFFQLLRLERPTLIYSAMLYANFVSQTCAKLLGITHIVSVRNNPSAYYKDSLMKRVSFVLIMMMQDSIIFISHRALSEYLSTLYGKILRKKQFFVLHNPIARDELVVDSYLVNKYLGVKKKIKYILNDKNMKCSETQPLRCVIASRLVDGKGILETLEQIRVSLDNPNIQLSIYGAGNLEDKVRTYVDKAFSNKNVFLKGFESDLNKIFADSDIFIFPSRSEGFGRAPFEALLRGNLVLCNSPVSIIDEFLDDSKVWVTYSEPFDLIEEIKFFENVSPDACLQELKEISSLLSYQAHVIAFEKIAFFCIRD
jgi:glycosyltransferase involved in cell wall biosynthesis